jgi:two-component system C4-dicarboxylate transport sensor histidine kinase DctB
LQRQFLAQRELEARVAERTSELASANAQLVREIDERQRAEANVQLMQDELVQANKLAVLGQISAGVAHEINQPVCAIRTYLDNAATMINGGQIEAVCDNLVKASDLTDRIGAITQELRAFSRKSARARTKVRIGDAIDGALILMSARTRSVGATISRTEPDPELAVIADRIRLEQVIVNLLQNALDALVNTPQPRIDISVTPDLETDSAKLIVADNGPGVAAEIAAALFTPFVTNKPQGLGLGLLISRDICIEFGGSLTLAAAPKGGAAFLIQLPLAHD